MLRSTPPPGSEQVAERLNLKMSKEEVARAKVDKCIVDRVKAALHQLKQCRSVNEHVDYNVVLGSAAPHREKQGNHEGMMSAIFKRLGVQRGTRYVKATGERRPRAPEQSVTRRAEFDEQVPVRFHGAASAAPLSRPAPLSPPRLIRPAFTARYHHPVFAGLVPHCRFHCLAAG